MGNEGPWTLTVPVRYCRGVEIQIKPWRVFTPVVADSHHSNEDPDPHLSEKLDPEPHKSEKRDPDPQ
jgi:hypothetical protein